MSISNVNSDREFTIAVINDSQHYVANDNGIFEEMCQWIGDNKDEYNIKTFLHGGDVVQNSTDTEWQIADKAFGNIEDAGIPYIVVNGNHDTSDSDFEDWPDFWDEFPIERVENLPDNHEDVVESGAYDSPSKGKRVENSYFVQEVLGEEFLFLGGEFWPSDGYMDWAMDLLEDHSEIPAALITHFFLDDSGDFVYDEKWNGNGSGVIWDKWLSEAENLGFVIGGHLYDEQNNVRTEETVDGETATLMHHNYQDYASNGGDGFLRLIVVDVVDWTAEAYTYSPYVNEWDTGSAAEFDFQYQNHWLSEYEDTARWESTEQSMSNDSVEFSEESWSNSDFSGGIEVVDEDLRISTN